MLISPESPAAARRTPLARRASLLLVALLALGAVACIPRSPLEDEAIGRLNDIRYSYGRGAVIPMDDLMLKARAHARDMARQDRLFHSNLAEDVDPGWIKLGENVGVGGTMAAIYGAFLASGTHKATMIDPAYNQVGVGVAFAKDGTMYIAQVFAQR